MSFKKSRIAIVGAGVIGLSCAWELLKRGADVTLFEKQWPPAGASWAAAGMLAPAYEAASDRTGHHPQFFDLCRRSAELWRGFATELEQASGVDIGYCEGPTLTVALDRAQAEQVSQLEENLATTSLNCGSLSRRDVAKLEPSVTPDFERALKLDSDGWVDPRQTLLALRAAFDRAGGAFELVPGGVSVSDLRDQYDMCLETSGADGHGAVQAVKGVMLAFRRVDLPLDHVVRCGEEYAVPRGDLVVVGATVGEVPDARSYLLSQSVRFLPRLRSAALVDQWSGWRPATSDHAPLMGPAGDDGLYIANGHYRNGILLAPATAQIMADMILDKAEPDLAASFSPARFGATA